MIWIYSILVVAELLCSAIYYVYFSPPLDRFPSRNHWFLRFIDPNVVKYIQENPRIYLCGVVLFPLVFLFCLFSGTYKVVARTFYYISIALEKARANRFKK